MKRPPATSRRTFLQWTVGRGGWCVLLTDIDAPVTPPTLVITMAWVAQSSLSTARAAQTPSSSDDHKAAAMSGSATC
jgi:hypothetical protein